VSAAFGSRVLSLDAAIALAHGLTIVTRNVKDFAGTKVKLVDVFAA
jgi:predicted nucleic acid-binding protein